MRHAVKTIWARISGLARGLPAGRDWERGSTLVLTGIAMAVLIGFTALAVDGGYLYFRHTELQDVADAVALAAARQLAATSGSGSAKQSAAFQAALSCVQRNGFAASDIAGYSFDVTKGDEGGRLALSFPAGTSEARVALSLNAKAFFAKVLSFNETSLGVTATAEIIRHDGAWDTTDLIPLAYFQGDYETGTKVEMTLSPGDGVKGNYGFLNLGCPCKFRDYLKNGYPGTIKMGDVVETNPGVNHGHVKNAMAGRLSGCVHGCSMTPEVSITEPCPRVVVVPMVAGFQEACGKSTVTITGFIKVFIEDYNHSTKVLSAWVLGQASGPPGYTGTEALSLRSARLK